jgi:hypothetical protein
MDGTHRGYYIFREKILAYIQNFCREHEADMIRDFMKENCFIKKTLETIDHVRFRSRQSASWTVSTASPTS